MRPEKWELDFKKVKGHDTLEKCSVYLNDNVFPAKIVKCN